MRTVFRGGLLASSAGSNSIFRLAVNGLHLVSVNVQFPMRSWSYLVILRLRLFGFADSSVFESCEWKLSGAFELCRGKSSFMSSLTWVSFLPRLRSEYRIFSFWVFSLKAKAPFAFLRENKNCRYDKMGLIRVEIRVTYTTFRTFRIRSCSYCHRKNLGHRSTLSLLQAWYLVALWCKPCHVPWERTENNEKFTFKIDWKGAESS